MWFQPPSPPPAQEPTPVSGIEIVARNGTPKVVATFPTAGAVAAPGALVLMVRFDHRMQAATWDYGPADGAPPCLERPRLLKDEKTFVLLCSVGFNKHFTVRLNAEGKGFKDLAGVAAAPVEVSFSTSDTDPTSSVEDALKLAGLTPVDSPILDDKAPRG